MRILIFIVSVTLIILSCTPNNKKIQKSKSGTDSPSDKSGNFEIIKEYSYDSMDRLNYENIKNEGKLVFIYDNNGNVIEIRRE